MNFKGDCIVSSHLTRSEIDSLGAAEVGEGVEVESFHVDEPARCVRDVGESEFVGIDSVVEVGYDGREKGREGAIGEGAVEASMDVQAIVLHDWVTNRVS